MRQMGQGLGRWPNQLGERRDPFGRTPDSGTGLNTSNIGINEPDAQKRARKSETNSVGGPDNNPAPKRSATT